MGAAPRTPAPAREKTKPAPSSSSPLLPGRRKRATTPFLLIVVDHDTGRFTIEGPMSDAEAWAGEVMAAQRAGRRISCRVMSGTADEAARVWQQTQGGTRWPSGFILAPVATAALTPSQERPPASPKVTPPMVGEALRILYRSCRLRSEAPGIDELLVEEMLRAALSAPPPATSN